MAKAGTLAHPKTLHLAEVLGLEPWAALGLLEAMWNWAAEYAIDGAIGRHINAVFADGVKWRAHPARLVYVLVLTKWLDPVHDSDARFVIHDWEEHKQERVKKKLERARKGVYAGMAVDRTLWLEEFLRRHPEAIQRLDGVQTRDDTTSRRRRDGVPSRARVSPSHPIPSHPGQDSLTPLAAREPVPEPAPGQEAPDHEQGIAGGSAGIASLSGNGALSRAGSQEASLGKDAVDDKLLEANERLKRRKAELGGGE